MVASSFIFPPVVAVLLGVAARVLVTGALHEDGLADFFDGFGGGTERDSVLRIMKDSHIGSYGVLGLVFYFAILVAVWLIVNEAVSIIENLDEIGVPMPAFLGKIFQRVKGR